MATVAPKRQRGFSATILAERYKKHLVNRGLAGCMVQTGTKGGHMKHPAKVMSLALALAMTGAMVPEASAKTPSQMQSHKMTHKASRHTKAHSGKRSKNRTVNNRTTTVMPGAQQGAL